MMSVSVSQDFCNMVLGGLKQEQFVGVPDPGSPELRYQQGCEEHLPQSPYGWWPQTFLGL